MHKQLIGNLGVNEIPHVIQRHGFIFKLLDAVALCQLFRVVVQRVNTDVRPVADIVGNKQKTTSAPQLTIFWAMSDI